MKEIINYELSDTVLTLDGSLSFWIPVAFIWPLLMFVVGCNKYTYDGEDIQERRGYGNDLAIWLFAAGFTIIGGLSTWRPMAREFYFLLATGTGDTTLSVVATAVAPILWLIWGVFYFKIGVYGSKLRKKHLRRQKRRSDIKQMLDRVAKNF